MAFWDKLAGLAGTAIGGPIAGALVGYGASKLFGGGSGKKKKPGRGDQARDAFDASVAAEGERGSRFSSEYEDRAMNYDPTASMNKSIQGSYDIMMPRLLGSQVGRGNLRTGFGAGEQNEYLMNLMASKAMEAENLRFDNMRDIGAYGERARDRTMDAQYGTYATERERRMQNKASKRGMWGQIGGAVLGTAGRVLASKL